MKIQKENLGDGGSGQGRGSGWVDGNGELKLL